MSEKKSWDVVRKPAQPARVNQPQAKPAAGPVSKPAPPDAHPVATHAPTLSNGPRRGTVRTVPKKPLREKRKKQQRIFQIVLLVLIVALIAGAFYVLWLPALRVNAVSVQGPDADGAKVAALNAMQGTYGYVVPRDSIFFVPQPLIRTQILNQYPDIDAVSIHAASLHGITIVTTPRAPAFVWCGVSIDPPPADGACFNADAGGLIFSPFDPAAQDASSTLRIFASLDRTIAASSSPIRAHVVASKQIPDALRLVKALRSLNANVTALVIQGDEGDIYLNGPTKILYVLGHEEQAAELAASSLPTLNLTDGSIDYIDLRFVSAPGQPGKVYVKRFGQ